MLAIAAADEQRRSSTDINQLGYPADSLRLDLGRGRASRHAPTFAFRAEQSPPGFRLELQARCSRRTSDVR
jgi:hypothetical protein